MSSPCSITIDREYRYSEYSVTFFNDVVKTTVTDAPIVLDHWIATAEFPDSPLQRQPVVAFDLEWSHYPSNRNRIAALHLCVGHDCLIFQIIHALYIPLTLSNFLRNRNYTFVGIGIEAGKQELFEDCGVRVGRCVDLTDYSRRNVLGLEDLANQILGVSFEQNSDVTSSDWHFECLTLEEVQYVSIDAYVSYKIGMRCNTWVRT